MMKGLTKTKYFWPKLTTIFLLIPFLFSLCPQKTLAAEGTYAFARSVVSNLLSDPTKTENSEYSKGLPNVEGIPWVKTPLPQTADQLKERMDKDKEYVEKFIQTNKSLEEEKTKAGTIADKWDYNPAHWVGIANDNPDDIHYNRERRDIINALQLNISLKTEALVWDQKSCAKKIAELELQEAVASNDPERIKTAQAKVNEALESVKATRKDFQKGLAEAKALNDAACWPGGSLTPNIGNCILLGTGWVGNIITWVFSLFLWVAGKIFDLSVYISISLIGTWFKTAAVANVWKIVRDLANLCFVFVLLYIALGTVFELSGMGDTRKLIVNVIVIALFVNFSGFLVRVAVDASNIIAYEFYIQMKGPDGTQSISTLLVKKMDLGRYFIDSSSAEGASTEAGKQFGPPTVTRLSFLGIIAQTFGNVIIILVTSFVLLAASVLFLIRTIYLIFLYILSPAAFVSKIVPKLNYFDKWMNNLLKQAFFAPAFLVPLYLVFVLLGKNGISSLGGATGGWGGLAFGGTLTLIMANIMIVGLLIGCIIIATSLSATGAKKASGWGKALGWGALGAAGGYTIGKAANSLSRSQFMQRTVARSPILGGTVLNTVNRVANSNFGTGTRGYGQRVEARRSAQQAQANSFTGPNADANRARYVSSLLWQSDRNAAYNRMNPAQRTTADRELRAQGRGAEADQLAINNYGQISANERINLDRSLRAQGQAARANELMATLSPEEAWQVTAPTPAARLERAQQMTDQQFNDAYVRMNAQQRIELENAVTGDPVQSGRLANARAAFAANPRVAGVASERETATARVTSYRGSNPTERAAMIQNLPQADLNNLYRQLNPQERVALGREMTTIGAAQAVRFTAAQGAYAADPNRSAQSIRETQREQAAAETTATSEALVDQLNTGAAINTRDVANIHHTMIDDVDPAILARHDVAPHLTIEQLNALRTSRRLGGGQKAAIRAEIERAATAAAAAGGGVIGPNGLPLAPGGVDPHLMRVQTWLNGPGSAFGD